MAWEDTKLRIHHCFEEIKLQNNCGFILLIWIISILSCTKEYSYEGENQAIQPITSIKKPPVAIAGSDTSLYLPNNQIILDGSASYDPDGTIVSWAWSMIEGPSEVEFTKAGEAITEARNLVKGIYLFDLKVSDNQGLSSRDTVQVKVDSLGSLIVFDHLQWENVPGCAFVIDNIYSFIPTTANFELFIKWVDTWGSVRDWKEVPKKGTQTIYDLFFYEIKSGSLIIHSTKIVCDYDESRNYMAGIKIY